MTSPAPPLVTIAIPTYNRADSYLSTAIEAALQQTYEPVEVIVADNCSTDHTPELVRSYEEKHDNLRYERHSDNIGALPNFQYCVDVANGAYLLLLHDDDVVDTDFVATCIEAADHRTHFGYIRTGIRCIDGGGDIVQEYPNEALNLQREAYISAWLQGKVYWYFASSLLNTEHLRSIGGFESDFDQLIDLSTFSKLALQSEGVDVPSIKASLREHDDRITSHADMQEWVGEYSKLKELLIRNSSPEWRSRIEEEADAFCGLILCKYADNISSKWMRFTAYLRIARAFGLQNVPQPLSKLVRCTVPSPVEGYLERTVKLFR